MKKILLIISLFAFAYPVFSQQQLYYFINKDSTAVGVKNNLGQIIIPAKFTAIVNYDFEKPITEPTIEFWGLSGKVNYNSASPAFPAGEVYGHAGNFLYYPQLFDNGPDYWEEGVRRYVENGKIGFVDKWGNKIIKAQWDFAAPFSYGYAKVYEGGWKKKYEKGGEHWFIVPSSKKSVSYLINKKGERITGSLKPKNPKDYFFENKYYPYPFTYNALEQKIVDSLNSLDVLNDINLVNNYTDASRKEMLLQFEIVEYPQKGFPYYIVQGYTRQNKNDVNRFAISQDGREFFHQPYFQEDGLQPLWQWIVEKLQSAKEFMQSHDAQFKFDADKALKQWESK